VAGAAISPAVTVRLVDGNGNTITTANNAVTIALGANPGGAMLGGTLTVNAVNGVAAFSTLTLTRAAAGYTLTASAGTLTGATSNAVPDSPAANSRPAFVQQPPNGTVRTALSPTVT